MSVMDLKEMVSSLGGLAAVENTIGDYYAACAAVIPADAPFWTDLAGQERVHASHMLEMARIVNDAGGKGFTVARPFPAAALRTFISGLQSHLDEVRGGRLTGGRLFFTAVEIEHALVEARFHEFLKTENAAFNSLVARVAEETRGHRALLERRAAGLRPGGGG